MLKVKTKYLITLFTASIVWFVGALTDALIHHAANYSQMSTAGKIFTNLFIFSFGLMVLGSFFGPAINYLLGIIRKKFNS